MIARDIRVSPATQVAWTLGKVSLRALRVGPGEMNAVLPRHLREVLLSCTVMNPKVQMTIFDARNAP
jgi:hypothetical protein